MLLAFASMMCAAIGCHGSFAQNFDYIYAAKMGLNEKRSPASIAEHKNNTQESKDGQLSDSKDLSLGQEYAYLLGGILSCSEQYSTSWAMARALIKKPYSKDTDIRKLLRDLDVHLSKYVFPKESDSLEKRQVIFSLKRLYYLALVESKDYFPKSAGFSKAAFAEQIISNSPHLNSDQREFRQKLHKTISGLSYLGTKFNQDCKTKPDTTDLESKFEAASIFPSLAKEKPTETITTSSEKLQPEESKEELPKPSQPTSNEVHSTIPAAIEPLIVKPLAPKPESETKPTPTHAKPAPKPSEEEPKPASTEAKPVEPIATTQPSTSDEEILSYVYQDRDCRERLPMNTRRLIFTQFERYVRNHNGNVGKESVSLFAKRAAFIISESSGGYATAAMAETDWSHTPYSRQISREDIDFSNSANRRFSPAKSTWVNRSTGATETTAEKFGILADLKTYRDVLLTGENYSNAKGARTAYRVYKSARERYNGSKSSANRRAMDTAFANLKAEEKKAGIPFFLDWVDTSNFGIIQMSPDRLIMSKERSVLLPKHDWLKGMVQNNQFTEVHKFCRAHDYYKDSVSDIEREFKKIQSCNLYDPKKPTRKIVTFEFRQCFAAWMMLCPGLNFHLGLYVPYTPPGSKGPNYFAYNSRKKPAVCTSSFEDILRKYKK